ncbi:MAG: ABC transporter substrate-binding protein [Prochloraceae cyanobacterium]
MVNIKAPLEQGKRQKRTADAPPVGASRRSKKAKDKRTIGFLRRCLATFLAIASTVSLSACNPSKMVSQENRVPNLVQATLSDPETFNPITFTTAGTRSILDLTFADLTSENPFTGEIVPDLAKSWEISQNGLRIVFTLREGLKWSDGKPLTADDVVFTYNELIFNEEIPTSSRDVYKIGQSRQLPKVRKIDDLRVEFTLPEPFAPFLGNTTSQHILPAHILRSTLQQRDEQGRLKFLSTWGINTPVEEIVASGPYKLKEYVPSQRIVFEKNPNYWQKDEAGNQLPYIDRIVWGIVESQPTALIQFRSGSVDALGVTPQYFALLKQEAERGDFTIYNGGPVYGTMFFFFNLNQGSREGKPLVDPIKSRWFNNVKFRQAVAYAVDRQRMVNNIYRGLGQLQNSSVSFQSPFYNENIKVYDYNPEKAKQLLLEAGFRYNDAGELLDDRGNRVTFVLNTNAGNVTREAIGTQIAQDLAKIGIKVDFVPVAWNTLIDRLSNSLEYESALLSFTGSNEPNDGANLWSVDGNLHMFNQKPGPGQDPLQGRVVADWEREIEDLFIQGAQELDFEKRKAIYDRAQEIVAEQLPFIYLMLPLSLAAVRNNIQTVEHSAYMGAFWNIEELRDTSFAAPTEE